MFYHWKSEAFADYYAGDIVVAADSVEDARQKVLGHWLNDYLSKEGAWLIPSNLDDELAASRLTCTYNNLIQDLEAEPVKTDLVFITGSA